MWLDVLNSVWLYLQAVLPMLIAYEQSGGRMIDVMAISDYHWANIWNDIYTERNRR